MKRAGSLFILIAIALLGKAQNKQLIVDASQKIATVQPTMWGIFFEDINFAADGGIYAELVKNRSFEFDVPLMGWDIEMKNNRDGNILIINRGAAFAANPRIARITVNSDTGSLNLINEGFRGIGVKSGAPYNFSLRAGLLSGDDQQIDIELLDGKEVIGKNSFTIKGKDWQQYKSSIVASKTVAKGSLRIIFKKKAIVDVDMISLFPQDTWKNRPGGLRKDLVQLLADMKPGFIRFPGGCIVEGRDLNNRYQWKKTVGDIGDRELIINRWNTEFKHKLTEDYFQSYGMGFYEYFLLADDLGAEPLPILNCGMACQFNTGEVVPVDELDPYIQDALDLIEFANGSAESKWGKLRASMGHPAPFNLKMMGVGNEQWGPQYIERYKIFAKAIHDKYPDIKLVSSVGPFAGGELFNYLNPLMRALKADLLDEHYYMPPEFFLRNATRYDNYDRNGPRIFAGEYAAHVRNTDGSGRNTWQAALSEAAFMTGLERNADVVHMSSYAPLFAHVDAWQWAPDLIWFDNLNSYGTPNYYVQKMFSANKGTSVVSITQDNKSLTGQDSLYASAVVDEKAKELIIKMVNASAIDITRSLLLSGFKLAKQDATIISLQTNNMSAVNSLIKPTEIAPVEQALRLNAKAPEIKIPAHSLIVLKLKIAL